MAEHHDLTVAILHEIRAEIRAMRIELSARIDRANALLGRTGALLDQSGHGLDGLHAGLATRFDKLESSTAEFGRQQRLLLRLLARAAA